MGVKSSKCLQLEHINSNFIVRITIIIVIMGLYTTPYLFITACISLHENIVRALTRLEGGDAVPVGVDLPA